MTAAFPRRLVLFGPRLLLSRVRSLAKILVAGTGVVCFIFTSTTGATLTPPSGAPTAWITEAANHFVPFTVATSLSKSASRFSIAAIVASFSFNFWFSSCTAAAE
jgi:hypothetical protein